MYGSPLSRFEEVIHMLETRRHFFETLIETVPEGARTAGASLWQHPEGHLFHRLCPGRTTPASLLNPSDLGKISDHRAPPPTMIDLMPRREADRLLPLLGLPVGFQWEQSPFLFLSGDDVLALSEAERDRLLEHGALLDRRACECLLDLGWEDRIGVRLTALPAGGSGRGSEVFETPPGFDALRGGATPALGLCGPSCSRIELSRPDRSVVLSRLVDVTGESVTPLVAAVEEEGGRRWGVLAFDMDGIPGTTFLREERARRLEQLFAWIARKPLPVAVRGHPWVIPLWVALDRDTSLLALANYSTAPAAKLELRFGRAGPAAFTRLEPDGTWAKADADFRRAATDQWILSRKLPICEILVYRIEHHDE
jgi:hypothetical protein